MADPIPIKKDMPPPRPLPDICCMRCVHYRITLADPTNIQGKCHRYPPSATVVDVRGVIATYFPGPKPHEDCAEFKPKLSIATT